MKITTTKGQTISGKEANDVVVLAAIGAATVIAGVTVGAIKGSQAVMCKIVTGSFKNPMKY